MSTYNYKPHSLTLYTDAMNAAVHVPDLLSESLQVNPEFLGTLVADDPTPKHMAISARKPIVNMQSLCIATLLDNLGLTALAIASQTHSGVVSNWQKFDKTGFAAGSNHRSYTYKKGIVVPKKISCQHRGDAVLTFDIVPIYDGTNATVVVSDAASLPTIVIATARWTLGPVTIGGQVLTEYTGFELDFGNTVETGGSASDVDETHVSVRTHEPKLTLTGIDPQWMSASVFTLSGAAVVQATDSFFLRKRAANGIGFVADGTAEHIKFTPNGVLSVGQGVQAEAQKIGQTTIEVRFAKDANGNAALAVDTTGAIS